MTQETDTRLKLRLIRLLLESGVKENDTLSSRRGIIFSNYIALILCSANLLLFIIIPQNHNLEGLQEALISVVIFSIPIFANRLSMIQFSQLYLCWVPPLLVSWVMIAGMKEGNVVPVSSYYGLRIYLVATGSIPYLLLERKNIRLFVLGILPSLLMILFFDYLLDFFGVETQHLAYQLTLIRTVITYAVISGSCLALRYVVDRTDSLNQQLISELEQKNTIIKTQAESELNQLNQQLSTSVKELTKREIILEKSQEIAKVGSWEYNLSDKSVFWSDQMYEIFGVDKSFDLQSPQLTFTLFKESAVVIDNAIRDLIKFRKTYDFIIQTKTPLGYVKWIRVFGYPLLVNDDVTAVTGIVHDVTLYKESEEQLKTNERDYRSLFEQASDGIMIFGLTGNFIDVNSSMCRMLGYSRNELLFMNVASVTDPEELKASPIRFDRLAMGDQIFNERKMIRKDNSTFFAEANTKMVSEGKIMAIARDITDRRLTEMEKEKTRYDLNERVKELTTLYKCGQILQTEKKPIHEVLQEIALILTEGWQYPSISAARIVFAEREFLSSNFGPYKHRQLSEFTTRNDLHGTIEVVYLEDRPPEAEGPFLAEERDLINMVAEMIRIYLSRRYEAEALRRAEANQSATINNTNFFIWSVNREYELISFNAPFADFLKSQYGIDAKIGIRLTDGMDHMQDVRDKWITRYNRALAGETFKVFSDREDLKLEYSLNPILEDTKIIGVSVFGEDISDRVKHEKEMLAINKQIGELRLMALRSAMNPHFIFNCLNSIQYYIMEKDQVNAITYLSTFSKLIRSILNNSVKNRVRLVEELEMLKLYVQLEAIRFENKFDLEICIDPEVDVEGIEIPSMLIQPYVENAILHGLCNKKEKGILKICIGNEDGMVLFEIEDNGVGREAASKLKQMNLSQHKSMGTALTEERLRLINEDTASVEILDLETGGKPSGTKVRVWIKE